MAWPWRRRRPAPPALRFADLLPEVQAFAVEMAAWLPALVVIKAALAGYDLSAKSLPGPPTPRGIHSEGAAIYRGWGGRRAGHVLYRASKEYRRQVERALRAGPPPMGKAS